jgi:hypothetical protein
MASVRDLKRDINYVLGDIIEAVYLWEQLNPEAGVKESGKIIDEAIATFDDLIAKVNANDIQDAKAHYSGISQELETRGRDLINRLNAL